MFGSSGSDPLDLTAYAPITASIQENRIDSVRSAIDVGTVTGGTAGFGVPTPGTFQGVVQRNTITTPDPVQSYNGIDVDLRPQAGSASHGRVYDKLVNGVGGCNCGGGAGVRITSRTA